MLLLPEVTCPWRASRRVRHAAPAACLSPLPGRIPGFGTSPWDDHDTITTYTAVICWQDRSNTAGQIARVFPGQQAISTTAEIQRCPGPTPRKSALGPRRKARLEAIVRRSSAPQALVRRGRLAPPAHQRRPHTPISAAL